MEMPKGASFGTWGNCGIVYDMSERRVAHLSGIYSPEFFASASMSSKFETLKNENTVDQFEVYKEIAGRVYRFIEFVNDLPGEVIVYLVMHTDVDAQGSIVPATVGKLLNEKVNLLGMVNVVILAEASGGEYRFVVDGKPPAKSCGAFDEAEQPNDLSIIDAALRDFLGWGGEDGEA